jgi:hypothetical protein
MLPDVPHGIIVEQAMVNWSRGQEAGLAILGMDRQDATRLQHVIADSLSPLVRRTDFVASASRSRTILQAVSSVNRRRSHDGTL